MVIQALASGIALFDRSRGHGFAFRRLYSADACMRKQFLPVLRRRADLQASLQALINEQSQQHWPDDKGFSNLKTSNTTWV